MLLLVIWRTRLKSIYRRPPLFDDPLFRPFSIITRTHTFDAWSALSTYIVMFPRPSTRFFIYIYIVCYLAFARIRKWYIVRYLRFSAAKMHLQAKKKRLGSTFRRFPVFDSALVPNLSNKQGAPVYYVPEIQFLPHREHIASIQIPVG
jgi:hypothetical protein